MDQQTAMVGRGRMPRLDQQLQRMERMGQMEPRGSLCPRRMNPTRGVRAGSRSRKVGARRDFWKCVSALNSPRLP